MVVHSQIFNFGKKAGQHFSLHAHQCMHMHALPRTFYHARWGGDARHRLLGSKAPISIRGKKSIRKKLL